MNFKNFLFGILGGIVILQSIHFYYKRNVERKNWQLGTQLDALANFTGSADAALQAKLIIAELKLTDPKTVALGRSMLTELISQNIQEDVKIRAKLILARDIRNDDPEYANTLFQEVAQQTLNSNEQLMAKYFIADQMAVKNPTAPFLEVATLLESILDKAKEINKDLAARIMVYLAMVVYKSDPKRAKALLEEVSNQDFNKFAKELAEKKLQELKVVLKG